MRRLKIVIVALLVILPNYSFASFTKLNIVELGTIGDPPQIRSTTTENDNGNTFTFSYIPDNGLTSTFTIKKGDRTIYRITKNELTVSSHVYITKIQNDKNNQIFYIINNKLMGYDAINNIWKIYVNLDDYYNPLGETSNRKLTIQNGNLCIYTQGANQQHVYILNWDNGTKNFSYIDKGVSDLVYFDDIYNYSPNYRPIYAHMDSEQYVDLASIKTIKDGDVWIFDVNTIFTGRNSDIGIVNTYRYMINKVTMKAWRHDPGGWVNVPVTSDKYAGYQISSITSVNWCYAYRFGRFMGNFDLMDQMAQKYKGITKAR